MPACFMEAKAGEFFAGAVLGDRADGIYVHDGVAAGAIDDVAGNGGAIVHRIGVRHAADGGEATRSGGA